MRISPEALLNSPVTSSRPGAGGGRVFTLRAPEGDRINGSMPSWNAPETPREDVVSALGQSGQSPKTPGLALAGQSPSDDKDQSFGFFDLVDMINPLQHIPVVGSIYRAITGDEIKPIGQIVGGAVFGGPLGAAGGVVNAIVQAKTGSDIGGNVMGMVRSKPNTPREQADADTTIAVANLAYRAPHYNE